MGNIGGKEGHERKEGGMYTRERERRETRVDGGRGKGGKGKRDK